MSSDLYDRIVSNRGTLERIVARIPGFRGYQEGVARRKADRMLRDHIVGELDQRIQRLIRIERDILDGGGLSMMSRTREVKTKVQTYRDRVATAAPKYAGPFESIKIGSEELQRIYSFDEAQLRYVDQLDTALTTLEDAVKNGEGVEDALEAVYDVAVEANDAFDLRDDVILNLTQKL